MTLVRLGDHCSQSRTTIRTGARAELRYVGLESIESDTGQLVSEGLSKTPSEPEGNSFLFDASHVLYGKLRPYLNKVALPDFEGKCSTEIIPLRPSARLDRRYLAYFLRCPSTVAKIAERTTGARMPRADMDFVLGLELPLPSLAAQRRVVCLLSRAEGIVRLRREAQRKAREIIPALFLDMFGDPMVNPRGWPVRHLHELLACPLRNGMSPSRTGHHAGRVLTLSAITRGSFDQSQEKEGLFAAPLTRQDEVSAQDFLVCRGNGNKSLVGVGCFPNHDMPGVAFPDTVIAIRPTPDRMVPSFFAAQWQTPGVRQQIEAIAKTTNGTFKVNQAGLSGVILVIPDMQLQHQFARHADALERITTAQSIALRKAEAALATILERVFRSSDTAETFEPRRATA